MFALSFAFLGLLTGVMSLNENLFDTEQQAVIRSELEKDCGNDCVTAFNSMIRDISTPERASQSVGNNLKWLMEKEMNKAKAALLGSQNTASFTKRKVEKLSAISNWNPLDTPCFDSVSCGAAQMIGDACSYGRVLTLATYQATNIALHIFAVIEKVGCICIDVVTRTMCVNAGWFPPSCDFPGKVFNKLMSMSNQIWEAVKGQTKSCKVHGHPMLLLR